MAIHSYENRPSDLAPPSSRKCAILEMLPPGLGQAPKLSRRLTVMYLLLRTSFAYDRGSLFSAPSCQWQSIHVLDGAHAGKNSCTRFMLISLKQTAATHFGAVRSVHFLRDRNGDAKTEVRNPGFHGRTISTKA